MGSERAGRPIPHRARPGGNCPGGNCPGLPVDVPPRFSPFAWHSDSPSRRCFLCLPAIERGGTSGRRQRNTPVIPERMMKGEVFLGHLSDCPCLIPPLDATARHGGHRCLELSPRGFHLDPCEYRTIPEAGR